MNAVLIDVLGPIGVDDVDVRLKCTDTYDRVVGKRVRVEVGSWDEHERRAVERARPDRLRKLDVVWAAGSDRPSAEREGTQRV